MAGGPVDRSWNQRMSTLLTGTIEISEVLSYLRRERYLDKKAAAEYLCWSSRKLEEYLPEIKHFKHKRKIYFKRSDLDKYMACFKVEASPGVDFDLRSLANE